MARYDVGDLVQLKAKFTGAAGDPADPDRLEFHLSPPVGEPIIYVYDDDAGQIKREEPGSYYIEVTPDQPGMWAYRWVATGEHVQAAEPGSFHVRDTLPLWAPSLEDVADVCPAYTRGGFDDDEPNAGEEKGTFTDTTSPTRQHVQGLIAAACQEVIGRVGAPIPERCYALARTAAKWHVAAAISAGKIPADTDDASGEYRSHITNYRFALDDLKEQVRVPLAIQLS